MQISQQTDSQKPSISHFELVCVVQWKIVANRPKFRERVSSRKERGSNLAFAGWHKLEELSPHRSLSKLLKCCRTWTFVRWKTFCSTSELSSKWIGDAINCRDQHNWKRINGSKIMYVSMKEILHVYNWTRLLQSYMPHWLAAPIYLLAVN